MNNETLGKRGYVEASTYRTKVVKSLGDNPNTPKKIAQDCGIRMNHISNILSQLKNKDIVYCVNEEDRKGRIYRLTEVGESIYEVL